MKMNINSIHYNENMSGDTNMSKGMEYGNY
jgi:hypothetical protein